MKRTWWVGAEGEGGGQDSRLLGGVVVFFCCSFRRCKVGCWLLNEQAIYCQQGVWKEEDEGGCDGK